MPGLDWQAHRLPFELIITGSQISGLMSLNLARQALGCWLNLAAEIDKPPDFPSRPNDHEALAF